MEKIINLELTENEVKGVLIAIGKLPFEQVVELNNKIAQQLQEQTKK